MNVSPNILAKNQNFRRVRHGFVDERALITTTYLPVTGNPYTYLFAKGKILKRIFNTNSELSQNRTEKQIMPLKQTVDCLFNNIY